MVELKKEFTLYDDTGGSLCINFINTVNWRGRAEREETLHSYSDYLLWCFEAGLINELDYQQFVNHYKDKNQFGYLELEKIKDIRETIYRILRDLIAGHTPGVEDQAIFNNALHIALTHRQISINPDRPIWTWFDHDGEFNNPMWSIILNAAELIVSDDLSKIHSCSNEECGWLFLDRSRNQSRKWCSSDSCGNRLRVRKFYRRSKEK